MKKGLLATLILGLILWRAITSPLCENFTSAIPYSERAKPGEAVLSEIVPGDHIQLLYHFWLCKDMIAGKTPAFSNVYEFTTPSDEGKKKIEPYYIPFSLIYALFSSTLGDAAGWNAAGLFSHILTLIGFFLLTRRLTESNITATAIAIAASAFPYRWITLMSGSPTGFAFCFTPFLFYGIHKTVRDGSLAGSFISGLALFFSYTTDLHVFYFSVLLAPVAYLAFLPLRGENSPTIPQIILKSIPLALFAVGAVAFSFISSNLGATTMAKGRTLSELKLYSPIPSGLFRREHLAGSSNHIFTGYSVFAVLLLGFFRLSLKSGLRTEWRKVISIAFLSLVAVTLFLFALGTHGPCDGLPIRAARKLIPKFGMIRQTAKLFAVIPILLAVIAALFYSKKTASQTPSAKSILDKAIMALAILLSGAVTMEYATFFKVKLCTLPSSMPTYEQVALDASTPTPKAIVATLWPGDSHYSSIYEYGIMHSRLRLINGYSPSAPATYPETYFKPFASINEGHISTNQIDRLRNLSIDYLIFHEHPYPGNVSPFPSGVAIKELSQNPYLKEIANNDGVIAYKLSREPLRATQLQTNTLTYLDYPASYHWNRRRVLRSLSVAPTNTFHMPFRSPVVIAPGMRYLVLDSNHNWHSIPLNNPMGETCPNPDGLTSPIYALVTAGSYPISMTNEVSLTPSRMFHTGNGNPDSGTVTFKLNPLKQDFKLFGPNLPVPQGRYRITIKTSGEGKKDAFLTLSALEEEKPLQYLKESFASFKGDLLTLEFNHTSPYPLSIEISGQSVNPLSIEEIRIKKIE